jgi:FkbM family methyltransferase
MSEDKIESYAQWGDDVLVWEYFKERTDGVFLEAGANNPKSLSQTYLLEKRGWTGVLVEPVPECCEKLRAERQGSRIFQNALGSPDQRGTLRLSIPGGASELTSALKEGEQAGADDEVFEAELITLTEVLDAAEVPQLDYLSLDLEGMELEALQGLDFKRFKPDLIIVEDRLDRLSRHRFLKATGYKLVRRNGSNNWYVPADHPFNVSLVTKLGWCRKFYLSMPFRRFRDLSRKLRGKR